MGQRKSKLSKSSYDVAPVVSNKDFQYERRNAENGSASNSNGNDVKVVDIAPQVMVATIKEETKEEVEVEVAFDTKLVPAWVNEDTFLDIVKEQVHNFEQITKFKAYPALKPGENYATLMLRVQIEAELKDHSTENISFMLKLPHDNEQMRQMLGTMNFFVSENRIYFDVIPELEQMYRDAGRDDISFAPKAYKFTGNAGSDSVLLEDLGPRGFRNTNRLECLDMEHTKCVLKKLAQFHAASACRVAIKGELAKVFMNGLYSESSHEMMQAMLSSFTTSFLSNVKNYKDGEKYYDIVQNYFNNFVDEFIRVTKSDSTEFNVLNHGDCWSNNILFKYSDDGKVVETLFVDYQNPKFGSPAQDLLYFIMSSINIEFKLKNFDYFIRFYHDHLIESLQLLKYPKKLPHLRELHMHLYKYGSWALSTSIITLPIVLLDSSESSHFENFMSDNDEASHFKTLLYTSKRYRRYIDEVLPWLHNRGLLDTYKFSSPDTEVVASNNKVTLNTTAAVEERTPGVEIPDWVTEAYFIDVLKKHVDHFKEIKKFEVSPATNAGDNYASLMLKVDIDVALEDGSSKSVSYMLKVAPNSDQAKAMLDMFNTFNKECIMYNEYIDKFEKLYKESGVDITFAPTSFRFTKDPGCDTVLLENLRPHGFKNADRLAGLDMDHTKAILSKLSAFHAASAYLYETKLKYPKVVSQGMFTEENRAMMTQIGDSFFGMFYECMQSYTGSEEYALKIMDFKNNGLDSMILLNNVDEDGFNVLNHGDCWTNNFLFQYDDEGKIKNLYFVDFQMVKYGSPAQDLYYFIMSSPTLDIKVNHFDYLIKFYHENLKKNLELLKYPKDIPSLKQLHMDLFKYGAWGVSTVTGVMSVVLLDPSENANMENMLGDNASGLEFKKQMYTNQRYRSHAEAILPWLNRRGLLDFEIPESNEATTTVPIATITTNETSDVPSWVDADHFVGILEEHMEGFSKILKLSAAPATKAGDNYASILLRVKIEAELKDGSIKNVSYMLKIAPVSVQTEGMLSMWNFFDKESAMYKEHLPEFESLYKEAGSELVLGPKMYSFKKEPGCDHILLEDLSTRGFKNADRLQGLDMTHTKCVLRKMAQLHAASVKRVDEKGRYDELFNDGIYSEKSRAMFEEMFKGSIDAFMECIPEYEGFEEYQHKIRPLLDSYVSQCIELGKIDDGEFNVLNHGDSWLNNIMFQYDDAGNILDTYYVDFQVSKYGPPAQDLYYFLMSSTQLDIKVDSFDYFIKYYHEHLLENCKLLKYSGNVPSLKDLHTSLLKFGFLGFATFMGVTTICLLEPSEHATIDTFIADTPEAIEFRKQLYINKRYKAHADVVLTWLNRRGLLDF